jgi:hypothetical protein
MKQPKPNGNGASKIEIHVEDLGGWVRVHPSRYHNLPEQLALFLSDSLTKWFRERPHCRLRTVVPVSRDGTTVELHAWFDIHVFPGPKPPTKKQP